MKVHDIILDLKEVNPKLKYGEFVLAVFIN